MRTEIWMPTVEAVVIFIVTLVLVAQYADRSRTPFPVVMFTIISWVMSFSMIMFIPLDIWLVSDCGLRLIWLLLDNEAG